MKTNTPLFLILILVLALAGCSSKVSMEDMQKQKNKALNQINAAQIEIAKLADMKEQYSLDVREDQIKTLESRQKQANKDIKSVKHVETPSEQDNADTMVENLNEQNAKIARKISSLKTTKQEDWTTVKDSINQEINRLERYVELLTSNVEALNKLEVE